MQRILRSACMTLACLFFVAAGAVAGGPAEEARRQIEDVMARQDAAWNRGDLEGFCASYTEDTVFITPTGLRKGRSEVLTRYRERYPDRAAQGNLSIEVLEFTSLAADAATIVGRWTLAYPDQPDKETATGLTLLVFVRDAAGEWKILRDASM